MKIRNSFKENRIEFPNVYLATINTSFSTLKHMNKEKYDSLMFYNSYVQIVYYRYLVSTGCT